MFYGIRIDTPNGPSKRYIYAQGQGQKRLVAVALQWPWDYYNKTGTRTSEIAPAERMTTAHRSK